MEFRRLLLPQLWSRDELVAFLYNLDEKNRFDAHEYCLSIGGYLVEIDTEEEEDWLLGAFAVYDQVWGTWKTFTSTLFCQHSWKT